MALFCLHFTLFYTSDILRWRLWSRMSMTMFVLFRFGVVETCQYIYIIYIYGQKHEKTWNSVMFCDPNPGIARWDLRYHRVLCSCCGFRHILKPLEVTRDNVPQSKKQYTQNSLSKLFLDLDISKGYQGGNSLNPWNSSRENCQNFKDRNDCKIVSNIKQFVSCQHWGTIFASTMMLTMLRSLAVMRNGGFGNKPLLFYDA